MHIDLVSRGIVKVCSEAKVGGHAAMNKDGPTYVYIGTLSNGERESKCLSEFMPGPKLRAGEGKSERRLRLP
jgi:hypothetical protein